MRIGVDFDNTIVCYDGLFYRLVARRHLLPPELPPTKGRIRDFLRRAGQEAMWTELQGEAYGPRILEATAFPGVLQFFRHCRDRGWQTIVVSHKTRHPIRGDGHDLHLAAHRWLTVNGFYDATQGALTPEQVYFELTKQAKLDRIAALRCDTFIDDLPEFLAEPGFPGGVRRILFDPSGDVEGDTLPTRAGSWADIEALLS